MYFTVSMNIFTKLKINLLLTHNLSFSLDYNIEHMICKNQYGGKQKQRNILLYSCRVRI